MAESVRINPLERAALKYASNNWAVFPLYGIVNDRCECGTNCGSPGKHPRVANGLHAATTDEKVVQAWWKRWPKSNIGVATGQTSGIYVIDLDNKRSVDLGNGILVGEGENSLRQKSLDIGTLPETLTSQTGSGGMHLIFGYPTNQMDNTEKPEFGNRAGILPSVDTRGDGGYIVAPPSLHQSGNRYRWVEEDSQISSIPTNWLNLLTSPSTGLSTHSLDLEIPAGFTVREGEGRHDWLFRMGSKLRGQHGLPKIALWGALSGYNRVVLDPPLEPKEVEHIVDSCLEYSPEIQLDRLGNDGPPVLVEGEDLAILLADFLAEDFPEATPLVERLLHGGECMILGGPPNVGKTWMAMDMMLGISSGTKFLGQFQCDAAPVLFIDEEGSRRVDYKRFSMLLEGRENSASEYPVYTKISSGIRLDNAHGHAALSRLIERHRPGAVFLDSLVRVHGGNENDNRAMAELFRLVHQLQEVYHVSFIFTHHIRKPAKDSVEDPLWLLRGASDIQGYPDSILIALPTEDSQEAKVIHTKMRDGKKLDPFIARIVVDDTRATVAYRELGSTNPDNPNRRSILDAIGHGYFNPESIAARTGLGLATVKEHLQVLEVSGHIKNGGVSGRPFYQMVMS